MTEQTTKSTQAWERPAIIRMAAADAENDSSINTAEGVANNSMGMAKKS